MNWLEDIRNKPHHHKIRIIWTVTAVVFILLLILWVASYKFAKKVPADTTLFKTIGRGFKDIKDNYKDIPNYINSQNK